MSNTANQGAASRRDSNRVPGPFQGRRLGALNVDIHIHDLSVGGCLIQSFHEVPVGRQMQLEIELPEEGTVKLNAESVMCGPITGLP